MNSTLATNTIEGRSAAFLGLCNAWRMTYSSITVDLDAAGLNDQGSIIGAQYPMATTVLNCATSAAANPFATIFTHIVSSDYTLNKPVLSLGQMPGAFMGLAKDGVYMPLKINPNADWANSECPVLIVPNGAQLPRGYALPNVQPATGTCFPFYGQTAYQAACGVGCEGAIPAWSNTLGAIGGSLIQPIQQQTIGCAIFYNLAHTARLTVKAKWGVEMMVPAVSPLAPTMKPSAHLDHQALMAFSELNASLPWAFPSSYNVNNTLLNVMKSLWNTMKPAASAFLSLVPHPAAKAGAGALAALPYFERPAGQGQQQSKAAPIVNFPPQGGGNGKGGRRGRGGKKPPPVPSRALKPR